MDLSTILVNYKSRGPLLECLASLAPDLRDLQAEVIVVDNDSRDGTVEELRARHPDVTVIANPENVGFARAVNQGLATARGARLLLINPDCVVRPGAVPTLIQFLDRHARTGIAAPRILNPDGSAEFSARAFPDHMTFLFNRYSLLTRLFPGNRFSRRYLMTDWDHASVRDVDWVSGACMMVRREALDRVGPMDEAFFMFNEDVDWCRRMNQAGWSVSYVPDAVVVHHIGASKSRVASKVIYQRHRGMIHYFHKHHPTHPLLSWAADALILARAGLMMAYNAIRR